MRRLPIFLVIDVSESMMGDNLRLMQAGIEQLTQTLRRDPYALETVYLSVIAFAGQAKTLAPLVELISFYPPRLPIGSGTSIGGVLYHTMNEIDRQVVRGSASQKGDFKPLVFLMSDGSSTDSVDSALARWRKAYQNQASLVAIGIGPYADLTAISGICEQVLRLEACGEQDFKQFIAWISSSVSQHSRSIGLSRNTEGGLSLEKPQHPMLTLVQSLQAAAAVDENYVILTGLCSKTQLPYLMKYEKIPNHIDSPYFKAPTQFHFSGVYAAEKDYFDWSDSRQNFNTINANALEGGCGCPHCGAAYGLASCSCGQVFCIDGEGEAVCPGCKRSVYMSLSDGDDYDIARSRG